MKLLNFLDLATSKLISSTIVSMLMTNDYVKVLHQSHHNILSNEYSNGIGIRRTK